MNGWYKASKNWWFIIAMLLYPLYIPLLKPHRRKTMKNICLFPLELSCVSPSKNREKKNAAFGGFAQVNFPTDPKPSGPGPDDCNRQAVGLNIFHENLGSLANPIHHQLRPKQKPGMTWSCWFLQATWGNLI